MARSSPARTAGPARPRARPPSLASLGSLRRGRATAAAAAMRRRPTAASATGSALVWLSLSSRSCELPALFIRWHRTLRRLDFWRRSLGRRRHGLRGTRSLPLADTGERHDREFRRQLLIGE